MHTPKRFSNPSPHRAINRTLSMRISYFNLTCRGANTPAVNSPLRFRCDPVLHEVLLRLLPGEERVVLRLLDLQGRLGWCFEQF